LKKYIPYIFIAAAVIATIILLFSGAKRTERKLDERISFQKRDKIPYGLYVAYNDLRSFFPKAAIHTIQTGPGYWDSLSVYDTKQALIIISPQFYPDEYEMRKLLSFVQNGNDVFISAMLMSDAAENVLNCKAGFLDAFSLANLKKEGTDSLGVSLFNPPFEEYLSFIYPGIKIGSWFYKTDTAAAAVIGSDDMKRNNFIHMKAGAGNLYVHLTPVAFTNYFLLYRNNIRFYENILSLLDPQVTRIGWDEYYLYKKFHRNRENSEKNGLGLLSVLFRYPGLKAALLTAFLTLLLFMVLEARRKQRYIPVMLKPRNDSLDFVKTIGRLYYDKGDHKDLCKKMGSYFLEHVRNRYKMATGKPDDAFIKDLSYKTGCEEQEIRNIVSYIRYSEDSLKVTEDELIRFHKLLESFYKKA